MSPPITRTGNAYASIHLPDPEALLRSGAPRARRQTTHEAAPVAPRSNPSDPNRGTAPQQHTHLRERGVAGGAAEAVVAGPSTGALTAGPHAGNAVSRPAPMTPGELLGLIPPDPARAELQAMLPALRQLFPIEQEVFQSRTTYGSNVMYRQDRGDDVFRMAAAIAGVQALRACLEHGPDLMSLAGWTPRQVLNWCIQPNGTNYLAVSAAEARRNPAGAPSPSADTHGLAGLPRLYDSMARGGTEAQRLRADNYRSELTALRDRFERVRSHQASQVDPADRHDFRETIAALFERAENEHDAHRITGQDFRAVAGHVMVWLSATER